MAESPCKWRAACRCDSILRDSLDGRCAPFTVRKPDLEMPTTSIHGTPDYAELDALGLDPSEVIYFSSNINPYGPPASVVEAVQDEISRSFLARYPDSRSQRLREKIGAYHGLPPDAVLVGNGTADLIWLLAHAYGFQRHAAILSPTFSEYADGVIMAGGHPIRLPLPGWHRIRRRSYAPGGTTLAQTRQALETSSPWLVFICNPNNPSGEYLSPGEMRYQLAGLVALDEMDWREETTTRLRRDLRDLQDGLRACGYAPLPTTVSYFLLPVGDAKSIRDRLVVERLFVRDCTSFGLPEHIRIAVRPPDENARLLEAMAQIDHLPTRQPDSRVNNNH